MIDINKIREDFPILKREIGDKPLVYLDSAATSQTPRQVVEAINEMYYRHKARGNRYGGAHSRESAPVD